MRVVEDELLAQLLPYDALIEALSEAFASDMVTPLRGHYALPTPAGEAMLLIMPAWTAAVAEGEGFVGTKIVSIFPGNGARGVPSTLGTYVLMSGATGQTLAVMNSLVLTSRRTAAASALAARYLVRADARRMVMVGAGQLAPHLVRAHARVRPIAAVDCWNRDPAKARTLAATLAAEGLAARAVEDLEGAVRAADLVSCATLSNAPLIQGAWLKPGSHLDLVGAFTPLMREADSDAFTRARVFVDTYEGALAKAGDLVGAIAAGALRRDDLCGDLRELCTLAVAGRRTADEITLFKSVGAAVEDLAAALLAWRQLESQKLADRPVSAL